ncbi:hypothetical protein [Teredinibacter turnerae]|uniref:hypothetical protein n=1 Tax=Teredinibacter turnerae TaxID=2426 RepID=UPI00037507F3|nr:hypothetical protein [Teredinibacter turnerae]
MSPDTETVIEHFREIFLWPFFFDGAITESDDANSRFDMMIEAGSWQPENDWYQRDYHKKGLNGSRSDKTAYGEFVYFQPYVQRFLYQVGGPMRVWRRDDVESIHVKLTGLTGAKSKGTSITCDVEQLWLFQFKLGNADSGLSMLAFELKIQQPQPISVVENFLDQMRRVYPPYWENQKLGRFPEKITIVQSDGTHHSFTSKEHTPLIRTQNNLRLPPISDHWRWFLDRGKINNLEKYLRQIEDERASTMAFLSTANPRQLTRGDFVRLCFADDAGNSHTLPYSTTILSDFEARYCYDRFWETDIDTRPESSWMSTRILNCGYAFTLCGSAGDKSFYLNAESGALSHFRNHYFMIALIAHFQRATLLLLSDRLSRVISLTDESQLHEKAKMTLYQLIDFTDRYWFENISTQVQPQELYAQWRHHLKLDTLYQQVKDEAQLLSNYLNTQLSEKRIKAARQETWAINTLTMLGAAWALITLLHDFVLSRWFIKIDLPIWGSSLILLLLVALSFITIYQIRTKVKRISIPLRKIFKSNCKSNNY